MSSRWQLFGVAAILVAMAVAATVVPSPSRVPFISERGGSTPFASPTVASTEEIVTFQGPDGGVIQVLQGRRARARLEELKAGSKRAGWMRADLNLMGRGLVPTDVVTVLRHIPASEIVGGRDAVAIPTSMSTTQDFEASINGKEIVIWSWDDGDDDTWEGTVQITRNSDGAYLTWDMQIEIPSATGYDVGDWWDIDDYGTEEGSECPEDPGEGCPIEVSFSPAGLKSDNLLNVILVSESSGQSGCGPAVNPFICRIAIWVASDSGRRERVRQFSLCTGAGLIGAGVNCAKKGPGFAVCAGIGAVAVLGGCAGYQLLDHLTGGDP